MVSPVTRTSEISATWAPTRKRSQANYQFGSAYYTTIRPSGYDTNLQWEQTAASNIGLDFGILQGRLSGSIEVYQKNTSKLLFTRAVAPGANLTNTILTNIGKVQNKGIELTLDAVAISTTNLTWNVGFNAAYNTNKITQLDGNNDPDFPAMPPAITLRVVSETRSRFCA